jgi:RNA polymerase sigma factor (sigma-70 family)
MKEQKSYSNDELIIGLRNEDKEVMHYVMNSFGESIYGLLIKSGATISEAEDCFMDAIEVVYRKLQDVNFILERASLKSYLSQIALNVWYKSIRKKKFQVSVTIEHLGVPIDGNNLEQELEEQARVKLFREKLSQLSPECQKLFYLSLVELESMKSISIKMGYTEEYVRKKKHGCKEKLFKLIQEDPLFSELKST